MVDLIELVFAEEERLLRKDTRQEVNAKLVRESVRVDLPFPLIDHNFEPIPEYLNRKNEKISERAPKGSNAYVIISCEYRWKSCDPTYYLLQVQYYKILDFDSTHEIKQTDREN